VTSVRSIDTIQTRGYMRRINLQTDLAQLADLIELVFATTMDSSGRAALREMRAMSRFGAGLRMLSHFNDVTAGVHLGFVWMIGDRLVGNVSIYPANYPDSLGKTWIVANVGVHPEYQGRGIARELMQASLSLIAQRGGKRAVLQVDADNTVAIHLYESLKFVQERTWIQWKRLAGRSQVATSPNTYDMFGNLIGHIPSYDMPVQSEVYIRHPRRSEWRDEWLLAQELRANGGLGWLHPLHITQFKHPIWRVWFEWLNFRSTERLVIRSDDDTTLLASAWIETSLTNTNKLILLISPDDHARCANALLQTITRRFGNASLSLEHPADDTPTNTWLTHYRFIPKRTVINMTWETH